MKNKILICLFVLFLACGAIFSIVIKDQEVSFSERRKLAKFPPFTFSNEWIKDVDKYFLDHFVGRDAIRSLKAYYNYNVLGNYDNNGLYVCDDYIFKSNYPTNKKSMAHFTKTINKLSTMFSEENNVYLMMIPDKNYYLKSEHFLHLDYDWMYKEVEKIGYTMIDVCDVLSLDDYYRSDTHWKQECLFDVVKKMSKIMKFPYQNMEYQKHTYNRFYGIYYGESAIAKACDTLTYLTNDILDQVKVTYLENPKLTTIYNVDKLVKLDAYDVFLDGASSFIEIENEHSLSDKECVIFRDSFGSSLTPLLVPYYKKITVVDNRYMHSDFIKERIEFSNQDILFLYSTFFVNDCLTLKG